MNNPIFNVKQWSLTARLLFFFACISLLVWIVATSITVYTSNTYIKTFFDNQQILLAKTLLNMDIDHVNKELPPTKFLVSDEDKLKREDDDVLGFALFSAKGEVLLTDGEHGKDFPYLPMAEGFTMVEVDDDDWRILWLHSADKQRIAAVGQEKEYRNSMILALLLGQIGPWIVILPVLLLGFGFALYRELAPLRKLAKDLNTREAQDTSPLNMENIPPEIKPLIIALNTLFERIGILLTQERAFVANAAHELRTPLAGLKIQVEVLAMSDEDKESQKHALENILQATNKCSHLIDQLLLLSQLENKYQSPASMQEDNIFQAIDWQKLINNACHELQDYAKAKQVIIVQNIEATPTNYMGIPDLWAIALRNMLDNAIRHSAKGVNVQIHLNNNEICVENSDTSIDENILPQLGKRFYRPSGQKAKGSGLGLAIVNHIANLHGTIFSLNNKTFNEQNKSVIACIKFNSKLAQ